MEHENLRAQVKSLQYKVNNLESEREFEKLRHEQVLQDVQERAEADFKKAQVGHNILSRSMDMSCVVDLKF